MGKYIKSYTKYIKKKHHQFVNNGTIFETDWYTTSNGRLNFGKGKTPYFMDGHFIYTTSNVKNYQKRHLASIMTNTWNYDDVKDASDESNNVKPISNSNDIRDFAYYGSCSDLVSSSITNIIAEFPGCIRLSSEKLSVPKNDGSFDELDGYIISNPFDIDLYHTNLTLGEYDNELRFLTYSWDAYTVNGHDITSYIVSEWLGDKDCPANDQWDIRYNNKDKYEVPFVITISILFNDNNDEVTLYGYKVEDNLVFLTDSTELLIKPKDEYIEAYFNSIEGFEKQLLKRDSKPLFKNEFLTPIEGRTTYNYALRDYTWPSIEDYCIDIESASYLSYVDKLYSLAQLMDELWTDNLYRNMTHEAIKNFDWTYTRSYVEGEEEDNVNGGNRMKDILHFIGRAFDDTKRNIDAIKNLNNTTYSGYNSMPYALLSDKLDLGGWDMLSIIPTYMEDLNVSDMTLSSMFLKKLGEEVKWFNTTSPDKLTYTQVDIDFMARLLLSSKRILSTKGTANAIDMVMGMFGFGRGNTEEDLNQDDYSLSQVYYSINGAKYKYDECLADWQELDKRRDGYQYSDEYDFPTLPISDVFLGSKENHFLIPYYNPDKTYENDLVFQSKGGWGKLITDNEKYKVTDNGTNYQITDDGINYKETLSYLHVVSNVSALLNINSTDVEVGDIYYVVDISDIMEYYEANTETKLNVSYISHFFKVIDVYHVNNFSGWQNIALDSTAEYFNQDDYDKVVYLDNIITTNIGNNPHVGYGKYDNGNTYINSMLKPFQYDVDNDIMDYRYRDKTLDVSWEDGFHEYIEDLVTTATHDNDDRVDDNEGYMEDSCTDTDITKSITKIKYIPKCVYDNNKDFTYYLNSKILIMENKHTVNDLYKEYFLKIMLPYVMQVIPSTTILILKGYK